MPRAWVRWWVRSRVGETSPVAASAVTAPASTGATAVAAARAVDNPGLRCGCGVGMWLPAGCGRDRGRGSYAVPGPMDFAVPERCSDAPEFDRGAAPEPEGHGAE